MRVTKSRSGYTGHLHFLTFICSCLLGSSLALANWTANVGYHNPAGSAVGLNFLYFGSKWGFEAGIGWVDLNSTDYATDDDKDNKSDDDDKHTTSLSLGGDIDVKYFFGSGSFKPYAQAGLGIGVGGAVGDNSGFGAGTGAGFGGLGLMFGSPKLYGYASYNISGFRTDFIQAGLGFDI